jgi:chemotaxis protein methyltransferase CheR
MIDCDNPTKVALLEPDAKRLEPGGWLAIGHAETLLDHHANLRAGSPTLYRKAGA